MTINRQGDDFFQDRLLAYLKKELPFSIENVTALRKHVYLVEPSYSPPFILKGFSSYQRLKNQQSFTASLKRSGFPHTYTFLTLEKNPPLFFEQTYYGCVEYISPSERPFSFAKKKHREAGLSRLAEFHHITEGLVGMYQKHLRSFKQLAKWRGRAATFLNHISVIKFFVQKEMIDEILRWADWSLKGLHEEISSLQKEPKVILHGDVAHHNFIQSRNRELFLIDFDLISIGHRSADYLQYANRILPYVDWSFKELEKLPVLQPYLKEKGFLYALAFPTDIFREWNRLIREGNLHHSGKVRHVLDLTVEQFPERQQFFQNLKALTEE